MGGILYIDIEIMSTSMCWVCWMLTLLCLQALGVDYQVVSASEIVPSYRAWCDDNFPGKFSHFYKSMDSQLEGSGLCELCSKSELVRLLGDKVCKPKESLRPNSFVELMVSGSPCDPFSIQRSKRWHDGSVNHHYQFDITMKSVVQMYLEYEPEKGILEQVWGFTMPFAAGSCETPKERQGGGNNPETIILYFSILVYLQDLFGFEPHTHTHSRVSRA